ARGPRDFESKSLPARTMVISAGVLMNTLFAFLVFTFSAAVWGVQKVPPARIASVTAARLPAGTEALAALPPSAALPAAGGRAGEDWLDGRSALLIAPAGPVTLSFADGRTVTVDLPAEDTLRAELVRALEPELAPVVGRVMPGSPA